MSRDPNRPCTARQRRLLAEAFEKTHSLTAAAKRAGVNQTRAWKALRSEGYLRERFDHGNDARAKQAKRLYVEEGLSIREAASRVGETGLDDVHFGDYMRRKKLTRRSGRGQIQYNGHTIGFYDHPAHLVRKLLDEYAGGATTRDLHEKYPSIPLWSIKIYVRKAGLARDSAALRVERQLERGHLSSVALARKAAALYHGSPPLSLEQTHEQLNAFLEARLGYSVSFGWMREAMEKHGVRFRSRRDGIRIRQWGSLEAFYASRRRLCYEYEVLGWSLFQLQKKYRLSYTKLRKWLDSKYNRYRWSRQDPPPETWPSLPAPVQMLLELEAEGMGHQEAIEKMLLSWVPAVPYDDHGQRIRTPLRMPRRQMAA